MDKKVTVCTLLYGDNYELGKRVVNSIIKKFPSEQYELKVGMNQCCEEIIYYISNLKEVDKVYIEKINIGKYPLMNKMFKDIDTEFVWWFDDDTFVTQGDAFDSWMNQIEKSNKDIVMWGSIYHVKMDKKAMFAKYFETSIQDWIIEQIWYKGLPIPSGDHKYIENYNLIDPKYDIWKFPTGYSWIGRVDFIKKIQYPFEGMTIGGDILLSEAIRQQGKEFCNTFYGLHVPNSPSRKKMTKQTRNTTKKNKEIEKKIMKDKNINIKVSDMLDYYQSFNYHPFYSYISTLKNLKIFVELGSWQGDSISYLARQIQDNRDMDQIKIYSIDLFEETPCEIMRNKYASKIKYINDIYEYNLAINEVRDLITTIKKDTTLSADDFEDNSVDFCFLDASHEYDSVTKDLKAWYPKIKDGGIISGHDYDQHHRKGVIMAVDDFLKGKNVEVYPKTSVWMHKKGGGDVLDPNLNENYIKKKYILINEEFGKSHQHNNVSNADFGAMKYLIDKYDIKSIVDIGCGLGEQVRMALEDGIKAIGIDGDHTLDLFSDKHFILHDYTKGPLEIEQCDLAWSTEFVEHVHEKYISNYFTTFQCCKKVMITYAPKGQGGFHHVNEQSSQYWVQLFKKYGFRYNKEETLMIRSIAKNKWIKSKSILFDKK